MNAAGLAADGCERAVGGITMRTDIRPARPISLLTQVLRVLSATADSRFGRTCRSLTIGPRNSVDIDRASHLDLIMPGKFGCGSTYFAFGGQGRDNLPIVLVCKPCVRGLVYFQREFIWISFFACMTNLHDRFLLETLLFFGELGFYGRIA